MRNPSDSGSFPRERHVVGHKRGHIRKRAKGAQPFRIAQKLLNAEAVGIGTDGRLHRRGWSRIDRAVKPGTQAVDLAGLLDSCFLRPCRNRRENRCYKNDGRKATEET